MGDFVTLELAKKLKEKGFREECLYHYQNWGDYAEANCIPGDDRYDFNTDYLYQCNNNYSYLIDAPTISQVLKWLREGKGIHICISCSIDPLANWEYEIVEIDGVVFVNADDGYSTYEESALAGIEYAIDNLI